MSEIPEVRQSRRQFLVLASLLGAASGTGLAGCGGGTGSGGPGGGAKGRAGKSGETLFIAGFQWGPPTHFNPFGQSAGWPAGEGSMQLVYETLLRYNILTGELEPGLGTGLEKPDDNTFVIPLQKGAKWHDGKPVTVEDVVYRFELSKRHAELDSSLWNYITAVEARGDSVAFLLKPDNYNPGLVESAISNAWILPKHIWEALEKKGGPIGNHENIDPVGSGPYKIAHYNQQQIALERLDDYWGKNLFGGLPVPKYINHPIFKGNQDGDLAFEQGKIDVMQQFTPRIWEMWEKKKKPVSTWFRKEPYHVSASIPMLVINTTKKGLDDPRVRRALAFAIDAADIAEKAMSRYSQPARSSIIVPSGAEEKYFDQANVDEHGWKYDPAESKRILEEELGAKKGSDGIYVLADGTRLGPWKAQTPNGWSDWQQALRIVAANTKKAGFDIGTEFPEAPVVTDRVNNGNFDFALWSVAGAGPASPWQRFRDVLDIREVPEVGKRAYWNYGRFEDPAVAGLLDELAAADSDDDIKQLTAKLDEIFMKNAPMIPLMYRPDQFFEYHESNWKNFPNEKNDYAPPQFKGAGINWLYKLERAK